MDSILARNYSVCSPEDGGVYMTHLWQLRSWVWPVANRFSAEEDFKISYYAPQPRAVVEVVDFEDHTQVVPYGGTGRVKLYNDDERVLYPRFSRARRSANASCLTSSIHGMALVRSPLPRYRIANDRRGVLVRSSKFRSRPC